jgi:hypothetical protein
MRAIEWSPELMRGAGLRRLYWNERTHQTTTNPGCPMERSGALPSAWQLVLPPGTFEGGSVSFPRTRGMWERSRFRLRVLIRTAPTAAGGQDVLLFDFDDLLTMELASPLAAPGTRQDVVLPLPPWPPGIAALREQYCVHTGWPQGRQCRQCWPDEPPTPATLYALVEDNPGTARHTAALALCELRHSGTTPRESRDVAPAGRDV